MPLPRESSPPIQDMKTSILLVRLLHLGHPCGGREDYQRSKDVMIRLQIQATKSMRRYYSLQPKALRIHLIGEATALHSQAQAIRCRV